MQLPSNFHKIIPFYTFIILFLFTSTIFAQISTDSLVAYYKFNGNADDSSGNGYNATFLSAASTTDRFGKDSSAFSFNGTNNTIQYGDILDEVFCAPIAKFTITGWANTKTSGSYTNGTGFIMGQNAGGSNGPYQWNIAHVDGFLYGAVFSDTMAHNYIALITPAPENEWYQFALVFDGTLPEMQRIKLYFNGNTSNTTVFQHVGTLGETTKATKQHLTIGASHEPNNPQLLNHFYDGSIDDIRIYAKALTQEEIDTLYNEGGWTTINHAPVANAGPDQTVFSDSLSGALIALDGSASSDLDGDTLTYTWKEADSTIANGAGPTVQLLPGSHTITLTVSDGKGGIDSDKVVIDVKHLTNNLAAYYPFTGNANDSSGNGYNATFLSAASTTDRFGKDSSAFSFNGTNNTIQYGDILDEVFCATIAKFTITGWAKTRTCGNYTTGGGMIMSKSSGGGGIYQWNITHQENLVNVVVVSSGTAQNYLWLTSPMTTNQWFQFTLVFDGSLPEMQRIRLYVNGTLSNTSVYDHQGTLGTTTQNSTQNICIGASHEFGNPNQLHSFYDGSIDDIRIYAKALTQEEIDTLYNEGGWTTINHAPVANAGPNQTVFSDSLSGALIALDGSASSDLDGDTLTYTWKEADSTIANGAGPTVQLLPGSHTITLTVSDGRGGIDSDQVVINISSLSTGLEAYYPFNGNANDESGNGYNAIFTNATLTADRFGNDSSAFSFDGIDDLIDFGDILDDTFCRDTAQFSISGWALTKRYNLLEGNLMIGKSAGGTGPYQWRIFHHYGIFNAQVFTDSTANNLIYEQTTIGLNRWFHFVLIFDGKQPANERIRLYVNNSLSMPSGSVSGTLGTSTENTKLHLYIGGQNYFSSPKNLFSGNIDDIRIYNRVLLVEEIDTLYHRFEIKHPVGVYEKQKYIPENFALAQNYPNPFNPSTTIRYELPAASNILIKVYNIIGQEVMVLKNGFEQAGYHEVTFENSSLPSGIYFYQMKAGSFFETKKMILMK